MAQVPFTDFILGGLADSEFFGQKNSMYELVGLDLHSQPGKVLVNQKLTKDSGSTVDALCKVGISVSDGSSLWFSSTSGKIWRELAGVWTLAYTVAIAVGDLMTATANSSEDISAQASQPKIQMKSDGSKMLVVNRSNTEAIYEYNMSPGYDVDGLSYVQSFDVSSQVSSARALRTKPDGLKAYVCSPTAVFQYTFSGAWDVSTLSYDTKTFSFATQTTSLEDIAFKSDGTKMYALETDGTIYQYTLSTPWDVSTASYDTVSFTKAQGVTSANYCIAFSADGATLLIGNSGANSIFQYTLGTAWDLSTATYDNQSLTFDGALSMAFDTSTKHLYVGQVNIGIVYQYDFDSDVGDMNILGAEEYTDKIYFATEKYLLQVNVADIGSAWAPTLSGKFTAGDDTYHPMKKLNGILYIGDSNYIAQVDEGTFTGDALDIVEPLRVSALGAYDIELLIGTYVSSNVMQTEFLRWNTWGDSWQYSDPIPEPGINAFLVTDNEIVVSAGTRAHLYSYNGLELESRKRLPGSFTRGTSDQCRVYPYSVLNYEGLPLFGVSQVSGNAVKYGLYSYGRRAAGYPGIFALEYVISESSTMQDVEVGAIVGAGNVFLVAWKKGAVYGVDRLDATAKFASAYMATRWIIADRREQGVFGQLDVAYSLLPANTDITIAKQVDAETSFGSAVTAITDAERMLKSTKENLGTAVRMKVKIGFTVSGNNAPEIEGFFLDAPE